MEHMIISRWAGWWGGWGSESDLSKVINQRAAEGWTLRDTEASIFGWFWIIPRHKLLMVFERPSTGASAQPSPATPSPGT